MCSVGAPTDWCRCRVADLDRKLAEKELLLASVYSRNEQKAQSHLAKASTILKRENVKDIISWKLRVALPLPHVARLTQSALCRREGFPKRPSRATATASKAQPGQQPTGSSLATGGAIAESRGSHRRCKSRQRTKWSIWCIAPSMQGLLLGLPPPEAGLRPPPA